MRVRVAAALLGLALFSATPAAAQTLQHPSEQDGTPADRAFLSAMHDMMVGMETSMPTGNTDRDFVTMMLPHHQGAVDMAKAELQYGTDPELKKLAQNIVSDQEKEIAMMKAWKSKHP